MHFTLAFFYLALAINAPSSSVHPPLIAALFGLLCSVLPFSTSLCLNPQTRNHYIFEDKVEFLTHSWCCIFLSLFSRIPIKISNSDIIVLGPWFLCICSSDMIDGQCLD